MAAQAIAVSPAGAVGEMMSASLLLLLPARAAQVPARRWDVANNSNAAPGSSSHAPTSFAVHDVPTPELCQARCQANSTCTVFAWSPNSNTCYFRLDHAWAPGSPNIGYVSGCVASGPGAVWGCGYDPKTAPCPDNRIPPAAPPPAAPTGECPWQVSGPVGTNQIAETSLDFNMLGINFDFWPATKDKWGTCGVLNSKLLDPKLLEIVGRLNGSLLRIGGSPADFMLYDVFDGACSAENINKTQPGDGSFQPKKYFCPIWDQVPGQCLTMARWAEINDFAATTGLRIALDLNACWGRGGATGEMDFTMISGLFNETARMAAAGSDLH